MAAEPTKVALITGGSGGSGLAVAQALAARGGWQIHLLDIKADDGERAAASLPDATFHRADLVDYDGLAAAFRAAWVAGGRRLDFVHANAGIIERSNLYATKSDNDDPPPQPDYGAIEINLKGTINTVQLARHYMQRSPEKGSIVITASCSSFWPTYWAPVYTASKFGIIGFTRAVASYFRALDGIRVNAVCPGAMRTAIIPDWGSMGDDCFTPLDLVADLVLRLGPHVHLHGDQDDDLVDSRGVRVPADSAYGLAVVVNGQKFYVQEEPAYCDDVMARTMEATKPENQSGANQGAAKQEGDEA